MTSGDTILTVTSAYVTEDHADVGKGVTKLHSGSVDVTIERGASGVHETLFDAEKSYNVVITEA